MGPTRTTKKRRVDSEAVAESSSTPQAGPSKSRTHTKPQHPGPSVSAASAPGVQKLKSALRQTRRLLAKDTLAADVRVETERRLKALEADLEAAELAKKERSLAVRYHKVKFFERQKVVRKLTQTKKKISASGGESDAPELQAALRELRVDLNYILHYPKTKKYISLFPPELRLGETAEPTADAGRDEVRAWVVAQMASGELSAEPELHLDSPKDGSGRATGTASWSGEQKNKKNKKKKEVEMDLDEDAEELQDAFFGEEDEDDDS